MGVIRLNLCRLTARNVLILVCVEVSVGEYHNVFHHFLILHVLILVCVEVSVGAYLSLEKAFLGDKS